MRLPVRGHCRAGARFKQADSRMVEISDQPPGHEAGDDWRSHELARGLLLFARDAIGEGAAGRVGVQYDGHWWLVDLYIPQSNYRDFQMKHRARVFAKFRTRLSSETLRIASRRIVPNRKSVSGDRNRQLTLGTRLSARVENTDNKCSISSWTMLAGVPPADPAGQTP